MNDRAEWIPFDAGSTLNTKGTEDGFIIRDETYPGARITLEECSRPRPPYASTCGFASMFHTAFAGTHEEATILFETMQREIVRILDLVPKEEDPRLSDKLEHLYDAFRAFGKQF